MQKVIIEGPVTLKGEINISGSKNASLPIMISTVLSKGSCLISNVPNLRDTRFLVSILQDLGCNVDFQKNIFAVHNSTIRKKSADYEYVRQMRASIVLLGPVIARYPKFKIALPGGCSIGTRGIDLHLEALKLMGVKISIRSGYVIAERKNKQLQAIKHKFPKISVGATQNIVMAASLANGKSVLKNCAIEPEVMDLINFLNNCGAKISIKNRTITILGVADLELQNHEVIPDRVEAGLIF
jgi:UDP-N-acetylglucosamine 1-carboxyvinyltransferase